MSSMYSMVTSIDKSAFRVIVDGHWLMRFRSYRLRTAAIATVIAQLAIQAKSSHVHGRKSIYQVVPIFGTCEDFARGLFRLDDSDDMLPACLRI